MSAGGPEWIAVTIVDVVMYDAAGESRMVRLNVGLVRMPNGGVTTLASQIQGQGRDLFLLPPASIARIMGALREGLRDALRGDV